MSYYCETCGKEHQGFPLYQYLLPEEVKNMSEEDRAKKVTSIGSYMVVKHVNHSKLYVPVSWYQKVKDTDACWEFKIWVQLEWEDREMFLLNPKIAEGFYGKLQSRFLWYSEHGFLGYPLHIIYDQEQKAFVVDDIYKLDSTIYNDYTNGLPLNVALDWLKILTEEVPINCGPFRR